MSKSHTLTVSALGVLGAAVLPTLGLGYGESVLQAALQANQNPRLPATSPPVVAAFGEVPQTMTTPAETATTPVAATTETTSMKGPGDAATGSPVATGKKGTKTTAAPAVASGKGVGKGVVPVAPPPPKPDLSLTAGWSSRYMFKCRDAVDWSSFDPVDSSIWYAKFALAYQGFGASIGYLQAVDKTIPRLSDDNESSYYSEVILGVNYTAAIIGGILDATVGYNAFLFPEDDYWGGNFQGEAFATLSYVQIPHIRPNVTYSYFHDDTYVDLTGYWLEFRIDGDFNVFDNGSVSVGLNPYVSVGYDGIDYTGRGEDWSAVEVGLRVPITINQNLIIALSGNYGWDLGDAGGSSYNPASDRVNEEVGFWGGASVTYRF